MKAKDIMTASPSCCSATDSIQDVARTMRDYDCGCVPVIADDSRRVVGIITDRDLAVRGFADGKSPDTKVGFLMTPSPSCCRETDDIKDVEQVMVSQQVRRVPIVDSSDRCIGIVSQADIARAASGDERVSDREIAIVVEKISEPSHVRHPSHLGDLGVTELEQQF
jgi:CBS domain-containing protein